MCQQWQIPGIEAESGKSRNAKPFSCKAKPSVAAESLVAGSKRCMAVDTWMLGSSSC